MNKSVEAVRMKLARLGLVVVEQLQEQRSTTREGILLVEMMTHEQVLKILAGAIARLQQPDLEKREVMQLRVLADAAKTYDSLLEKFERWVVKAFLTLSSTYHLSYQKIILDLSLILDVKENEH